MAKHPRDEQTDEQEEAAVDAPDGQVPAPRRPALPRLRRVRPTAPTALPFAVPSQDEDAPRVADLSALLADIDALRLTLQTDLSLAAAALDEGAQDLAAELVDGDLAEVRSFAGRAADRLAGLAEAPDEALPALVPVRRRRILSAAPLMAAAAALVGFVALSPGSGPAPAPETSLSSATMAGYELSRLASEGAPDEELRVAAEELNDEVAALIAKAAEDPVAAQQALMLLEQTTEVLASQGDSGVLRGVMAETRALREQLREALPALVKKRPVRPVVRPVLPVVPRVQDEPEKERPSSAAPKSSPKPSASPKPSPSPAQASPTPEPPSTQQPAPQGSPQPGGPLPDDDGIPGV